LKVTILIYILTALLADVSFNRTFFFDPDLKDSV
jgi:hypothetical protein